MAKKMVFELVGDLPEDAMEAAEVMVKLKPMFVAFSESVTKAGLAHTHMTSTKTAKAPKGGGAE